MVFCHKNCSYKYVFTLKLLLKCTGFERRPLGLLPLFQNFLESFLIRAFYFDVPQIQSNTNYLLQNEGFWSRSRDE